MLELKRREVIKRTLIGSALVAAFPGALIATVSKRARTESKLTSPQSESLLQVTRHLFPHSMIDISIYREAVAEIERMASTVPHLRLLLISGCKELDQGTEGSWLQLSKERQVTALAALETTEFFKTLWQKMSYALYQDQRLWAVFGYEGPSYDKGGYITRGFNDIGWVPAE